MSKIEFDDLPEELRDWIRARQQEKTPTAKNLEKMLPSSIKDNYDIDYERVVEIMDSLRRKTTQKKKKNLSSAETFKPGDNYEVKFPFKTKINQYAIKHALNPKDLHADVDSHVRDYRVPLLIKKFKRPDYSPEPYSYEMDIMFTNNDGQQRRKLYLVLININTRYLIVVPLRSKSTRDAIDAFNSIYTKERGIKIRNIKYDGESGFISADFIAYLSSKGVENIKSDDSKYTFHNKIVDSAIRTIRNAAGLSYNILRNDSNMQAIVNFYNNTPHNSLPIDDNGIHYTPKEMQDNIDLEWYYIREKDRELADANERIKNAKLDTYEPGNILLLYLDHGKDREGMRKRRRNFQDVGEFITYHNGNVRCARITSNERGKNNIVELPIFFTKKIANNKQSIPKKYVDLFNLSDYITSPANVEVDVSSST